MTKVDDSGETIIIREHDGLVKVDGIPIFMIVMRDGKPWLRVCDRNKMRSKERGDQCIEMPLSVFIVKLLKKRQ